MAGVATAATIGLTGWLAIGSTAIALGQAGASFSQAAKSRRDMRDAESEADMMMQKARKRLDKNYMEQLSIKKEPYELQREALLVSASTSLDAAREGDQRGAAAAAGRVGQVADAAQGKVRAAMGSELQTIEQAVAKEDSRLRDLNVQLDLGEIQGAQQAAADAEKAAAAATAQGMQGVGNALQSGLSLVPLYAQNTALQKAALGNTQLTADEFAAIGNVKTGMGEAAGEGFTNLDLSTIPGMSNREFRQFKRGLDTNQRNLLFGNQSYQDQYAMGLSANQQLFAQNQSGGTSSPTPIIPTDPTTATVPQDGNMASYDRKKVLMNKMSFGGGLTLEEQAELQLLMNS